MGHIVDTWDSWDILLLPKFCVTCCYLWFVWHIVVTQVLCDIVITWDSCDILLLPEIHVIYLWLIKGVTWALCSLGVPGDNWAFPWCPSPKSRQNNWVEEDATNLQNAGWIYFVPFSANGVLTMASKFCLAPLNIVIYNMMLQRC